jgi:arsenate reductase
LALLENSGKDFEVVKYLDSEITAEELKGVLSKLGLKPIDLIRKNEAIWKSDFKGKAITEEDLINAMITHPKLIERPIVINGNKAIIGRPPESILNII